MLNLRAVLDAVTCSGSEKRKITGLLLSDFGQIVVSGEEESLLTDTSAILHQGDIFLRCQRVSDEGAVDFALASRLVQVVGVDALATQFSGFIAHDQSL